jgi:hypothetical protein
MAGHRRNAATHAAYQAALTELFLARDDLAVVAVRAEAAA